MTALIISFPPTPYTNTAAVARLRELGMTELIKENEDRVEVIKGHVLLSKNAQWGDATDTTLVLEYKGALPKSIEHDLKQLEERDVISNWEKDACAMCGKSFRNNRVVITYPPMSVHKGDCENEFYAQEAESIAQERRAENAWSQIAF